MHYYYRFLDGEHLTDIYTYCTYEFKGVWGFFLPRKQSETLGSREILLQDKGKSTNVKA